MPPKITMKIDANQKEIVAKLRSIGAKVLILAGVGQGCPDILVGWQGKNYLMEIKDGNKIPSKRKLTPAEQTFFDTWKGQVAKVESVEEAFAVIGITY